MSYPLACADFAFPLLSHDHALDLISMIGVEGVDIGLFEGRSHLHPSREFGDPAAAGESLRRATIYACGLGFFDLHVNGQRIGDQLMNPALTGYDKRLLYNTFDVTRQLTTGRNALGVVLSNGRFFAPRSQDPMPMQTYGYPKLLLQLQVEFDDGTRRTIVTDPSWKLTAAGPIIASSEFDGEQYDARLEMPGWDAPGFDDSKWQSAHLVDAPGGQLEAQMIEPIRITEKLKPIRVTQPQPNVWMADFGQAFYGVVQLNARGPAGTCVTMRTSFNVLPNGTLNFLNDRSAKNTDVYTLKGAGPETAGPETWHPRFRGNATRWVQVEGYPGVLTEDCLAGLVTHTDHERVGEFSCSNELINRIFSNARWGTRMQNRSVPMEPDRDERMPWSGHPAKTSESEGWVFGVARFYDHFLHNYRAHQGEDGSLQEILSGNFEAWCFQTLGGINCDPRQPGFKHVILRPRPVGNLQWVRASHNSMYGKIASDWKIERETFEWRIVVPPEYCGDGIRADQPGRQRS